MTPCKYTHTHTHIYMYIYIEREREREREGGAEGRWGRNTWHTSNEKTVPYHLRSSQSDTIKVDEFILSNTHSHTYLYIYLNAIHARALINNS